MFHNTINSFFVPLGWGDDITWVQTYEEGLDKMKERYLMIMIHCTTFLPVLYVTYKQIKNTPYLCFTSVRSL